MGRTTVSEDDENKPVIDADGEKLGLVTEVRSGTAYVDPDPGLTDQIRSTLGMSREASVDDIVLQEARIDTITGSEIRLKE